MSLLIFSIFKACDPWTFFRGGETSPFSSISLSREGLMATKSILKLFKEKFHFFLLLEKMQLCSRLADRKSVV